MTDKKTCTSCKFTKTLDHFHKSNRATGGRPRGGFGVSAKCKECTAEARRPGIIAERERVAHLLTLGMKTCSICNIDKPLSAFNKRRASEDGVCFRCRECDNAYVARWRKDNPDAHKTWYAQNRKQRSEDSKIWRLANKEHAKASYAQWAKENKHIVNAIRTRRRAAQFKATPSWANQQAIRAIYAEAARLTAETGIKHEVDHIYPLQGKTVCGLHCEANLQILTKTENIRKHNKMPSLGG